jgi:hypothetical protein
MRGVCTAGQQHHRQPVVLLAWTVRAPYIKAMRACQEAGSDEVYLGQVGGRLAGAFDFLATQVLPQVREPDLSRCSVLL